MYSLLYIALCLISGAQASQPPPSPWPSGWPHQGPGSTCPSHEWPPPPLPEPITITELPLPPVSPSNASGACSSNVNPQGTGCIDITTGLQNGNFLPDGKHVLAMILYAGAPEAPNPASVYTGQQVIILKADNSTFPNGDSWKCITCGVPAANSVGFSDAGWSYPQAFHDGLRVLAGNNIISCGNTSLIDAQCTPNRTHIYPIRFDNKADGSGSGAMIRELRLHPDNVHIGLNVFGLNGAGQLSENAYFGRLSFNAAPTRGTPLAPRYEVVNANLLVNPDQPSPYSTEGGQLFINSSAITVGELRGFSGTGLEVNYIGASVESCNIDVFAADLQTGRVRRLTSHPGYCDPIEVSADDRWMVIMDTRFTGRVEFMDGLRWIPPVADLIIEPICASTRNNGNRRFFQPWLLDHYGDRGNYYGQSINNAHNGIPGSGGVDDPEWNGMADPWFSPDGTRIVYGQLQTVSPACGGENPLPCYNSTEPGGRQGRVMLAHLTSRIPKSRPHVAPAPDVVPWAIPYVPGTTVAPSSYPREGDYTLKGKVGGSAAISVIENSAKTGVQTVTVQYSDYSDDGTGFLNGYENITVRTEAVVTDIADWYSNLTRTGCQAGTQFTSSDGFHLTLSILANLFEANGTLTTVTDGQVFKQPGNGD